jgi:hypothetical protein
MPKLASALEVQTQTVLSHSDGTTEYEMTEFFGGPLRVEDGPQSFLADTKSDAISVRPHFHVVDQFQIFWKGGKMGNRPIVPLHVHYHDAYTIYGPITAAPEGLRYMTVRSSADPGPRYMPGSRKERGNRRGGRHLDVSLPIADVPARDAGVEALLGPFEDGLAVYVATLGPGSELPRFSPSGGVHYIILAGTLEFNDAQHPPISDLFAGDEGPEEAKAGPDGLTTLVLVFRESLTNAAVSQA